MHQAKIHTHEYQNTEKIKREGLKLTTEDLALETIESLKNEPDIPVPVPTPTLIPTPEPVPVTFETGETNVGSLPPPELDGAGGIANTGPKRLF